jgi:hypothetical protein
MLARFVLVGVVLAGCSKRNDTVCCLTAADCESIGLSASDVGNRGCRDGESCVDLSCVPTPPSDASNDGNPRDGSPGPDAPWTGRCDPSKDFTTITDMPNVHVAYGEHHFVLSSDELTAYIVRDNHNVFEVTTSVRASKADDFPVDAVDPLMPMASHAFELFPSRQEHLLYFHTRVVPMYALADRATTTDSFANTTGLSFNSGIDPFPTDANLAGVGLNAERVYYTETGYLHELLSSGPYSSFGAPTTVTSMAVDGVALSPDELTLYYSTNPATGVFVSKRADKSSVFGPGTQIAILGTYDQPQAISGDDCVLYIIGNDTVSSVTKPH